MTDPSKIKLSHTQRAAYVYIRQSTPGQVELNRESTARQYALADRAGQLGWGQRTSGDRLAHVGIVLGLEVSRLTRNNADWYRLLELCGVTDTRIGDNDGVYHPALFHDRLLLGLKGTRSEAELRIIRARLDGGIRNKAARGELRRGLPVGLVWGEQEGEVLFPPHEAVWLWFRSEGLSFPLQTMPVTGMPGPIHWVAPTYHAVHQVLTNPVYAGAYPYGKIRLERYLDEQGAVRKRVRHLPMEQWAVLIQDPHPGFIDWAAYQANQVRLDSHTRPQPRQAGRRREGRLGIITGHRHLRPLR